MSSAPETTREPVDLDLDAPVTRGQFFKAVERMSLKLEEQLNKSLEGIADQVSARLADHATQLAAARKELSILDRKVWISIQLNTLLLAGEVKPPLSDEDLAALLEDLSKEYDNAVSEMASAETSG